MYNNTQQLNSSVGVGNMVTGFGNQYPQEQQINTAGSTGMQHDGFQGQQSLNEQKQLVLSDQQQQQQPQDGAFTGAQNPFYKTRICRAWREGVCPNGDTCCYAHGELELRHPNMDLLKQQDFNQMQMGAGRGMQPFSFGAITQYPQQQHRPQLQQIVPSSYGGFNPYDQGDSFREMMYKTKMCPQMIHRGWCSYGDRCNFAHTRQEIRPYPMSHDIYNYTAIHRADLGVPQYRDRGYFVGQPRPDFALPDTIETMNEPVLPKQVTYLEKVRGLCGMIGLGNATDYTNKNPYVVAVAAEAIENGYMLKGNAYADDVRGYSGSQ